MGKRKKGKRAEIHRISKDNPYMNFNYSDAWHMPWKKVNSRENNKRYVQARKESVYYLQDIFYNIDL